MHKPCPTCGDDGDKWVGRSGGLIVGDEGKPTVQCQACGTHATETTWNAPRAYERQISALEAEVAALKRRATKFRVQLKKKEALFKTADKKTVRPGMKVWVFGSVGVESAIVQKLEAVTDYELFGPVPVSQSYSTKEAARKAQQHD